MISLRSWLAVSLACLSLSLQAADAPAKMETTLVTATRTPVAMSSVLQPVTVITADDIQRLQAVSLMDVLRGNAGVTVVNNGGPGKNTSVFLRGMEADQLLVLVDGVKMGSATVGGAAFQDIPVELIDRIEIVRGPRSGLYGSEAMGGVIQVFTKQGGEGVKPSFSVTAGTHDTTRVHAGVSGGDGKLWYNANAGYENTGGFNSCRLNTTGSFTCMPGEYEPDDDGYRNVSGSFAMGYRIDEKTDVAVNWLRTEGDNEYDGSYANESETSQTVYGAKVRFAPADFWQVSVSGGYNEDASDDFWNGLFVSRFVTERQTGAWQNDFQLAKDHLLTIGGDYQNDRVDSNTPFAVDSRKNTAGFIQYQGGLSFVDVQASLRQDDNEQFGHHDTGSFALGFGLAEGLRLVTSYGTAFKAPTFNELYYPFFGNPNLKPEDSESVEISLKGEEAWGHWEANVFQTDIDDLIAYDSTIFLPNNIDEARIRGVEGVIGFQYDGWFINTALTLLEPEIGSGVNEGNTLPRRAEQSLRVDVDKDFGRWSLGGSVVGERHRWDDLANTRDLGGYATVDLRAEYALSDDWRVQVRAENLFNKEYETAEFYPQPGQAFYLTVRYQPGR